MSENAPLIIVTVSNPAAFFGKGSLIVLEYTDVAAAAKVARKIARETGRCVTIRSSDTGVIDIFRRLKSIERKRPQLGAAGVRELRPLRRTPWGCRTRG